jgi:hypothetical protein
MLRRSNLYNDVDKLKLCLTGHVRPRSSENLPQTVASTASAMLLAENTPQQRAQHGFGTPMLLGVQ